MKRNTLLAFAASLIMLLSACSGQQAGASLPPVANDPPPMYTEPGILSGGLLIDAQVCYVGYGSYEQASAASSLTARVKAGESRPASQNQRTVTAFEIVEVLHGEDYSKTDTIAVYQLGSKENTVVSFSSPLWAFEPGKEYILCLYEHSYGFELITPYEGVYVETENGIEPYGNSASATWMGGIEPLEVEILEIENAIPVEFQIEEFVIEPIE